MRFVAQKSCPKLRQSSLELNLLPAKILCAWKTWAKKRIFIFSTVDDNPYQLVKEYDKSLDHNASRRECKCNILRASRIVRKNTHQDFRINVTAPTEAEKDPFLTALGERLKLLRARRGLTRKALAQLAGVKFESEYNSTTIDPPELIRFLKQHHADVPWNLPEHGNMMTRVATAPKVPPTRAGRW